MVGKERKGNYGRTDRGREGRAFYSVPPLAFPFPFFGGGGGGGGRTRPVRSESESVGDHQSGLESWEDVAAPAVDEICAFLPVTAKRTTFADDAPLKSFLAPIRHDSQGSHRLLPLPRN